MIRMEKEKSKNKEERIEKESEKGGREKRKKRKREYDGKLLKALVLWRVGISQDQLRTLDVIRDFYKHMYKITRQSKPFLSTPSKLSSIIRHN